MATKTLTKPGFQKLQVGETVYSSECMQNPGERGTVLSVENFRPTQRMGRDTTIKNVTIRFPSGDESYSWTEYQYLAKEA